jgi:hypothetical protein
MFSQARRCTVIGARLLAVLLLAWAHSPTASRADESAVQDQPAPTSVEEMHGSLKRGFERKPDRPVGPFRHRLRTLPPFLRDTHLGVHLRTYYFDRDNTDGTDEESWAGGGSLTYQSGRWRGLLSVGAELFTSQRLYGPEDRDGLEMLRPRQIGLTVLGKAHLDLHYKETLLARLYRQDFDLPYLNRDDSRMIPNTFEAYGVRSQIANLDFYAGHVTKMKTRGSRDFISMSEAAGAESSKERGLSVMGAIYQPREGVSIGAIDYYAWDVMNTLYAEADYTRKLTDEIGLKLSGQLTHQRSIGEELLGDPSFDTYVWGGRAALSRRDAILTVAFSSTSDDFEIQNPYGSYPGYLSLMRKDFNRAGELAWLVGASYHFKRIGIPGLSAFANFARGTSARDGGSGDSLPNQQEIDLTVDYHLPEGRLKGFWVRFRYAYLDVDGDADRAHDLRVILNCQIPIL